MKIVNQSQKFLFPVSNLTGDSPDTVTRLDGETDEDYQKRSLEVRGAMADATISKTEDVTALQSSLNPKVLSECLALGARLPTDMVEVTMSVGSLIFDLYQSTAVQPTAPLAVALFSKRLQNLASSVLQDEFELEDRLLPQLRKPLEDESLWNVLDLTLSTEVNGQKVFLRVNHNAAMYFPKVLEAALSIFIPE